MDTLQIDIVRGLRPGLTLRAVDDDDNNDGDAPPTMVGHFSVFNAWYEIDSWFEGRFLENVAPGAFRDTFAAHWDEADYWRIKAMFDHGFDFQLGDKLLGSTSGIRSVLREDKIGAYYEVPLFRGVPDLLVDGIAAGEYGASFRFRVNEEHWVEEPGESEHNPQGLPERTILATSTIEFGPTPFGASLTATAGLRSQSLTDQYYESLRRRDPSQFEDACRRAGREIPTGRVDPRRTTGGGMGDEPTPAEEATTNTSPSRAVRHTDLILRGVIKP